MGVLTAKNLDVLLKDIVKWTSSSLKSGATGLDLCLELAQSKSPVISLLSTTEEGKPPDILPITEHDLLERWDFQKSAKKDCQMLAPLSPVTINEEDQLAQAIGVASFHNLRHIPVTRASSDNLLIFSVKDALKVIWSYLGDELKESVKSIPIGAPLFEEEFSEFDSFGKNEQGENGVTSAILKRPLRELFLRPPLLAAPDWTCGEALLELRKQKQEALAVVEYGTQVLGTISVLDLIIHQVQSSKNLTLKDLIELKSDQFELRGHSPVFHAYSLFMEKEVEFIPVLNEDGIPMAMLTSLSLLNHVMRKLVSAERGH